MQPDPGSERRRDVAVGPSRVAAAGVFGTHFDDVQLTSYDDFRSEVDLPTLRSLALVAAGSAALISELAAGSHLPERVLVGLPADLAGKKELLRTLEISPQLRPAELTRRADQVVVRLAPADTVPDADAERVLAELRELAPASPGPASGHARVAGAAAPRTRRVTGRRTILASAAAALGVLTAIVLVLIGRSDLGADGVLVGLLLVVVGLQGALGLGLGFLLRANRRLHHEQQKHHDARIRQLTRVSKQSGREGVRGRARILREVEQTRAEVQALGRLVSRLQAEVRDGSTRAE